MKHGKRMKQIKEQGKETFLIMRKWKNKDMEQTQNRGLYLFRSGRMT